MNERLYTETYQPTSETPSCPIWALEAQVKAHRNRTFLPKVHRTPLSSTQYDSHRTFLPKRRPGKQPPSPGHSCVLSEQCLVTATIQHLMHYCCITFDQLEHQTHDHCQFNNFLDNRNVHSDASTPSERHCRRGIANFCVNQLITPNVSAYYFLLWLWLGHLLFMSPVIQKNHWLSGLSHYCWQSVEDHQFCACSLVSNLSGVEYQDMQRVDLFLLINKADNQQIKKPPAVQTTKQWTSSS